MIEGAKAKKLDALIKRLTSADPQAGATPPPPEGADRLVHELVFAFMLWEAGPALAADAIRSITDAFVDYNEARIGMSDELADLLPKKYPLAEERCRRLRVVLNTVFSREHALSLQSLDDMPKREGRAYLESIEGMTPFVASRVTLIGLSAHAFPVDRRLVSILTGAGVCDAEESPESLASKLERYYRAGQAAPAYLALEGAEPVEAKKTRSGGRKGGASATKSSRSGKSKTKAT
ncbi:MAG: hypothetical protein ACIARR_10670 [Phycisphaerales bacterium JB059]